MLLSIKHSTKFPIILHDPSHDLFHGLSRGLVQVATPYGSSTLWIQQLGSSDEHLFFSHHRGRTFFEIPWKLDSPILPPSSASCSQIDCISRLSDGPRYRLIWDRFSSRIRWDMSRTLCRIVCVVFRMYRSKCRAGCSILLSFYPERRTVVDIWFLV